MDMIRTTEALTFQDFLRYPALRVEEGEFAFVTGRSGAGKSTYLLLLVVLVMMRVCRIDQTRLLVVSSMKMTVQLILAGLILTCKNAKTPRVYRFFGVLWVFFDCVQSLMTV